MRPSEIKHMMISSLDSGKDTHGIYAELEKDGVNYDFSSHFDEKVINRLFGNKKAETMEVEFTRSMTHVFYRIALTGVAAIVLMLISIFLMEGSLSFNSFLGLGNSYDESTICLLTGN
jgi:hypothetical protein